MRMRLIQRDLYQQVRSQSIAMRERITDLARPLDGDRLLQRPASNAWSVGEVLEHLCVTEGLLAERTRSAMASARADAAAPLREWKSTMLGGFIASSLENPRKVKAPSVFRPVGTPRPGVLEAFRALQHAVVQMMDDAQQLDWRAVRIGSPALPSWAPKYNLGDVFRIHAVHTARHAGQIGRIVAAL
jgi:hypothetical protein